MKAKRLLALGLAAILAAATPAESILTVSAAELTSVDEIAEEEGAEEGSEETAEDESEEAVSDEIIEEETDSEEEAESDSVDGEIEATEEAEEEPEEDQAEEDIEESATFSGAAAELIDVISASGEAMEVLTYDAIGIREENEEEDSALILAYAEKELLLAFGCVENEDEFWMLLSPEEKVTFAFPSEEEERIVVDSLDREEICEFLFKEEIETLDEAMLLWNSLLEDQADLHMEDLDFEGWEIAAEEALSVEDSEEAETEAEEAVEAEAAEEAATEEETSVEEAAAEEAAADSEEASEENTEEISEEEMEEESEASADELTEEELLETGNDGYKTQPERITLNITNAEMYEEETLTLRAQIYPENAEDMIIHWESSSDDVLMPVAADTEGFENTFISKTISDDYVSVGVTIRASITLENGEKLFASAQVTVKHSDTKQFGDDVDEEGNPIAITDGVWVTGFVRDGLTYTGSKVTQDLRVYDHNKLLTLGKDYSLTYKNNINAAPSTLKNSPYVQVTMKGQYVGSKKLFYSIAPKDISDEDVTGTEDDAALNYNGKTQKYVPIISFGKLKLKKDKDFTISYAPCMDGDDYKGSTEEVYVYSYTVTGTGNYTGSRDGYYAIVSPGANVSKAVLTFTNKTINYAEYPDTEEGQADWAQEVIRRLGDIRLKFAGATELVDPVASELFEVSVENIKTPGTAALVISSVDEDGLRYVGTIRKTFTIKSPYLMKNVKANPEVWQPTKAFNQEEAASKNGICQPDENLLLTPEGTALREGIDYVAQYKANRAAGTASVSFVGKGLYSGTLTLKFKITPAGSSEGNALRAFVNDTAVYQAGGALANVLVMNARGGILRENVDYTVTITNNKKAGEYADVLIKGKGNYAGALISTGQKDAEGKILYDGKAKTLVKAGSLAACKVVVPDIAYSGSPGKYKAVPVVYDVNGKKLVAGKDYSKEYQYQFLNQEVAGTEPVAGTTINVKVTGMGNYVGSANGCYHLYEKEKDIKKLYVAIDPQYYIGLPVEPQLTDEELEGDIHIYTDKQKTQEIAAEDCVRIVSYEKNTVAGTGKVTLEGIGLYGGTKAFSFKILKREFDSGSVKGIAFTTSERTVNLIAKKSVELEIAFQPENAENRTLYWESSNGAAAAFVTETDTDGKVSATDKKLTTTDDSKVVVYGVDEGTSTIKVVSQDSGASATIKIVVGAKATLVLSDRSLVFDLADGTSPTKQLSVSCFPASEMPAELNWSSANPAIATVSETGLVTAIKAGTTTIEVSAEDGALVDTCTVTVGKTYHVENYIPNNPSISEADNLRLGFKAAIEACNRNGGGIVRLNPGTYDLSFARYWDWGDSYYGILMEKSKNVHLDLTGVTINMLGTKSYYYGAILMLSCENCSITGGTIVGDKGKHLGSGGEDAHVVRMGSCVNVTLKNMNISNGYTDGIYIGDDDQTRPYGTKSEYINIYNCNVHDNRRNNLSITVAENVYVDGSKFNNAKGIEPQFGIDIEPNFASTPVKHCIFKNVTCSGNAKAAIGIMNRIDGGKSTYVEDVRFEGCSLNGNFYNWAGKKVRLVNTTCTGEIIDMKGGIIQ